MSGTLSAVSYSINVKLNVSQMLQVLHFHSSDVELSVSYFGGHRVTDSFLLPLFSDSLSLYLTLVK